MAENSLRRRNTLIVVILAAIIVALLLLSRCSPENPPASSREAGTTPAQSGAAGTSGPATSEPAAQEPDEVLTPATLQVPERVTAGAAFPVVWAGPDNRGDYVAIVPREAIAAEQGDYQETRRGRSLELTAPIEPGAYEVRYVTGRSHSILGRASVEVTPAAATLDAAAEVVLGSPFSVAWTGPSNKGDSITIVPKGASDDQYGNYMDTEKGSPLILTAPTEAGEAEIRYLAGQGRKVLARRAIRVVMAEATLDAPAEAIAGSTIQIAWKGPNNAGDYVTVVPRETPDGQYGNYMDAAKGSPLNLLMPIMSGEAELRYVTGQGRRVLARRPIKIVAAEVKLSAPAECAPGAAVSVVWTGPGNPGDYVTIVAKGTPDGQYAAYTTTDKGSPLSVKAPGQTGEAEIRYMTGQGNKVLARIAIKIAS